MEIVLRACTEQDTEMLRELAAQTFCETFAGDCSETDMRGYIQTALSPESVRAQLQNPASLFICAFCDGAAAGYVKLNEAPAQGDIHDPDSLEIERIYAYARYHGTGLGGRLMEAALDEARRGGKKYVWLGVWDKNAKALAFYRKHGFYEHGEHDFLLGETVFRDLIMRRDIS